MCLLNFGNLIRGNAARKRAGETWGAMAFFFVDPEAVEGGDVGGRSTRAVHASCAHGGYPAVPRLALNRAAAAPRVSEQHCADGQTDQRYCGGFGRRGDGGVGRALEAVVVDQDPVAAERVGVVNGSEAYPRIIVVPT